MIQFHPSNPYRIVSWRWERARMLREANARPAGRERDDSWLTETLQFQIGLTSCRDDVERWDLMESSPDIYSAYMIHQRGDGEERHPMRFAIEARLLSGQPPREIADALGVTKEAVDYYEKVFFNVNEKLRHSDYIMTCVIGPSVHAGLSDRDYDLLWKLFGYLYGPVVLDSFITTTSRRFRPESITEVDAALAEDARSALQRKVAIVARTFSINPFSQSELLNIYARFLEVEKASGGDKAHDVILQNVQVMLDKLPFQSSSDENSDVVNDPQITHYDKQGAELRSEELLIASIGEPVENRKEVENLKFPEPKKDGKTK